MSGGVSAQRRRFRATVVKLVVFVALGLLAGSTVYGTLLGGHVGSTDTYHAIFADVSGLKDGDPVRVSGVRVGEVDSVDLVDATHIRVTFDANRDQRITDATHAVVRYENLLGQRFLALTQVGRPTAPLAADATIPQSRTAPAVSLTALFNGFRPLFESLDANQVNQLTGEIVQVLQGQSGTVGTLIAQTAELTGNLADRSDVFSSVVKNLSALVTTVVKHDAAFGTALDDLDTLTAGLADDAPAIGQALDSVDRLTAALRNLVQGVDDGGVTDFVAALRTVAGTLAKNSKDLDATILAFPRAFTVLDRATQNGSWVNAFPCVAIADAQGTPKISAQDGADALALFLDQGKGTSSTLTLLLKVLGLTDAALPFPVTFPNGVVGDPSKHTGVCR